jgi:hypothetical protein
MPPEALLAAVDGPDDPQGSVEPATPPAAVSATQRTAKQRKRDFRRDRRRRRRIAERVASDPTLTDCTKTVAFAALAYSDDSAKPVYPSMAAIAEAASCVRRSARRCMVDLVDAGYVRRIQRPIASRRNATNLYYFCEPLGPPSPHRDGQRRVPRTRLGRLPTDAANPAPGAPENTSSGAQNPSSHRRTAQPPEPAEQVPNPASTEPSASAPSASTSKTTANATANPESPDTTQHQAPGSTPQPNRDLAYTHLRAAREALRDPNEPPHRTRRPLTP